MASVTVAYATFITGNPSLHLYMYILYSNHNPRILIMRVIFIYICILTLTPCIGHVSWELFMSPAPGIKPPSYYGIPSARNLIYVITENKVIKSLCYFL